MEYQMIFPGEVKNYLYRPDVQVIDLRGEEAYAERHLKGALSLPYPYLWDHIGLLDKRRLLFLYCEKGSLSLLAAAKLAKKGYRTITLTGGISALAHKKVD